MKALASFLGAVVLDLLLLVASDRLRADDTVTVHEWGTFTCLQDEHGESLGAINVDDEPVPTFVWGRGFVHAAARTTVNGGGFGLPPYMDLQCKGWKPADSEVTMRLETPVIYIYPPKGVAATAVPPLNVHVDFHGGLLSQFYPYADTNGFPPDFPWKQGVRIGDCTTGLTWKNVRLGSSETPVATDDKVWTTPREVSAPVLQADSRIFDNESGMQTMPQAEHFLFYRGIGHLGASLRLQQGDGAVSVWSQPSAPGLAYDHAWLAEIRADGTCAFREVAAFGSAGSWRSKSLATIPGTFAPDDFRAERLDQLKASMHDALVKQGLYDDEATAMLKTWELSYFKSPGVRFFYLVPRLWTDRVLPLNVTSVRAEITRVMVGRIELVSPAQRQALARLAAGPCPDLWAIKSAAEVALRKSALGKAEQEAYYGGAKPLGDLGIALPPWVRDYLSLGRFRDALIVHEEQEHPSAALAQFIKDNGLATARN